MAVRSSEETVEVILTERIEKLGQLGELVSVKPGFARNFLLPKGKAVRATNANKRLFKEQIVQLEAQNLEKKTEAESLGKKMDGLSIILIRQAGESGQLYGSVTKRDTAVAISDAGFTVDRSQIRLEKPIKALGLHSLTVDLHPEVQVNITANIARSHDEAKAQKSSGKAVVLNQDTESNIENIDSQIGVEVAADEAVVAQAETIFEDGVEIKAESTKDNGPSKDNTNLELTNSENTENKPT